MARERSCHSPSLAQESLCYSYGSASLRSFDMLCICHECSYMQGYTHFPQFLPGSCFCIEAHKNSRLAERKTKQVFTINHIVCKRAWQTGTKNTTLSHRENFKIPFLRCQPTSVLQQAFTNLPLLGCLC